MKERQKRLIEVYEHLRRYFGIHTKTGLAEALHYGRTSLSAAMNGDEKYLTDSLFKNICEAYPNVFNIDYLLTGKGSLLTIEEEVNNKVIEKQENSLLANENFNLFNATIAAKDETIAALREQLTTKDELIAALRQQIQTLQQQEYLKDFPVGTVEGIEKQDQVRV